MTHPITALRRAGIEQTEHKEGDALHVREVSGSTILKLHSLLDSTALQEPKKKMQQKQKSNSPAA